MKLMRNTILLLLAVILMQSLVLVTPASASDLWTQASTLVVDLWTQVSASLMDLWAQVKVPIMDLLTQIKIPEYTLDYGLLFYGSLFILIFRLISFSFLSFIYTFVKRNVGIDKFLSISIIIPAYNEEITISSCIKSMLGLNYPCYEIIVIDDGSSDNTFNEALKYSGERVKVIRQKNTGKPGAVNTGIKNASGEVVITVDADSKLHPDALKWIARRFSSNPRLGAVAGNVKIDKPTGLLKALQSLEYTTDINLGRKSQSMLHCVMVVPGAVAALKTHVLREVGYFPEDTFAEDFDITMKVLRAGYHVEYESRAMAFTQAPDSVEDFIKQRRRWYRGMTQVLAKYQNMYFNPKYGTAGMFGVPYMWLGLSSYLINMLLLSTLLISSFYRDDMNSFALGVLIYWALSIGICIYAELIDPMPRIKEIIISPLFMFYNIFIDGVGIMSLIEELLSLAMRWEKPKREELE